jgi:Mg-chelatase subunit ChlD
MSDNTAAVASLSEYDFVVVVDASGSMGEPNKQGSAVTRWEAMQETAVAFTRDLEKIDSDGIGVVVFSGAKIDTFDGVTTEKVREIFAGRSPRGSTPLAEALTAAINLGANADKKKFILVFTDGVPDDEQKAAQVIINQANKQETDDELTFLFVQVGTDAGAAAYLRTLDDDLSAAKFDIVDAKTVEEAEAFATTVDLIVHAISD